MGILLEEYKKFMSALDIQILSHPHKVSRKNERAPV